MNRLIRFAGIATISALSLTMMSSPAATAAKKQPGTVVVTEPKAKNQFYDEARAITVDHRGRAVVAARIGFNKVAVYRMTKKGKLDKKFGNRGRLYLKTKYEPIDVTTDRNGRVILAIASNPHAITSTARVIRFTANGKKDKKFGKKGTFQRKGFKVSGVVADGSGRVIVTGQHSPKKGQNFAEAFRLSARGKVDTGFGSNGRTRLAKYAEQETGYLGTTFKQASFDRQGRILILTGVNKGILTNPEFGVTRLLANGQFDATYGSSGAGYTVREWNVNDSTTGTFGSAIAVHPDSKVFIGGNATSVTGFLTSQFDEYGNLTSDISTVRFTKNLLDKAVAAVPAANGRAVSAGLVYKGGKYRVGVMRTNADGTLDKTFGKKGKTLVKVRGYKQVQAVDAAVDKKGRIYVLATAEGKKYGTSASRVTVIRLKANGKIDKKWGR
ncbi:delta-60 repeat domain-containing protein [Micrococcales bacterium KH10]|nr:delta-60 repeat domain-containing protein [Micrococcales bacterium KH10]